MIRASRWSFTKNSFHDARSTKYKKKNYTFLYIIPLWFSNPISCPLSPSVLGTTDHCRIYEVFSLGFLILNIMQEVLSCSFLLLLEDSYHRHQEKHHLRNMDHQAYKNPTTTSLNTVNMKMSFPGGKGKRCQYAQPRIWISCCHCTIFYPFLRVPLLVIPLGQRLQYSSFKFLSYGDSTYILCILIYF